MRKIFIFLLAAIAFAVDWGSVSRIEASQNPFVLAGPAPTPGSTARIQQVNLDKNQVTIPCPPLPKGITKGEGILCDDDMLVKVGTSVSNAQNSKLIYYYTVSGGRIAGEGENVTWDLNGVGEGAYIITIVLGDGKEIIDPGLTKTVEVRDCGCCLMPCICPTVAVSGGGQVKAGETADFTAHLSGNYEEIEITYQWTVSSGEIIEGQGTSTIKVKTNDKMAGEALTATVQIGGFPLACSCQPTASETATVRER